MDKNKELFYIDAIVDSGVTPEELEEQIEHLIEESDKLTEWPEI